MIDIEPEVQLVAEIASADRRVQVPCLAIAADQVKKDAGAAMPPIPVRNEFKGRISKRKGLYERNVMPGLGLEPQ